MKIERLSGYAGKINNNPASCQSSKKALLTTILLLFTAAVLAQQNPASKNWSQFRGPNGSGVWETTGLPAEFGPDKNVVWKTILPTGYSSPVLTKDYIFVTASEGEKLLTLCLNRDGGKILWQKEAPRSRITKIDNRNNPASPSAVTDGKQVFVFFPDYGMLAYDLKGNESWRLPLEAFDNAYGMGASPILVDNKLILVCDQNIDSYIIAVNPKNGKVIWKKPRPEAKSGHSTPIAYYPEDGDPQIIVPGSFLLIAYSAKTGEKIWWVGGLSFEMKSTPVIDNNVVFINGYATPLNQPGNQVRIPAFKDALSKYDADKNSMLSKEELPNDPAYRWFSDVDVNGDKLLDDGDWSFFSAALASLNGMLAIRLGGQGDMTASSTKWHYRRSVPQLPSPLIYKNVLYMVNDGGIITTFKPESGDVIQQGRIEGAGNQFYASPVAADGKIFIISRRGKVSVLNSGGSLDLAASCDLGEQCYATPAIAEGKIYIRTESRLYCFGQKD